MPAYFLEDSTAVTVPDGMQAGLYFDLKDPTVAQAIPVNDPPGIKDYRLHVPGQVDSLGRFNVRIEP